MTSGHPGIYTTLTDVTRGIFETEKDAGGEPMLRMTKGAPKPAPLGILRSPNTPG